MRRLMSHRPSPAMVVAFIALLAALGTSAYAQLTIPRNSVGNAQLKRNAVTSSKVRNGSLLRRDFRRGQLPRGPRGFPGPQGPAGERGPAGPAGPAGPTNTYAANVDGNGTVLGSVPAGVTSNRLATGIYRVDFPRAVSGCLIFSAFGSNDGAINPGSTGVIPATGENPNRVAVATFNNAGALEDRDFYVQMTCP
jgi:hypothetical protein